MKLYDYNNLTLTLTVIIIIIIIVMDTNVMEHQKGDQERNSIAIGKVVNNKHTSAEGERHTVRN
jgi:hypothetical protein